MRKSTLLFSLPVLLAAVALQGCANKKLDKVFNGNMLDTNLRYFESIAGIPHKTFGDTHLFVVDGCNVEATAPDGKVASLSLELSDTCHVDLSSFLGSFTPESSKPLTFGDFSNLKFTADCLQSCGNAYEPSVYALWEGPHAANFINVKLEAVQSAGDASDAAQQWEELMQQERGEDYVIDTKFNCDSDYDDVAAKLFEKVRVSKVTIGSVINMPGCD